ncbi:amidohydrolase family protein [Natronincola ferrireducens]|uniref:Amidohydrolase family protein n=1 Tax=Natronincola ferrireducens TaxID=393762 RepID=A0A1G8Z0J7_9FIRM|nr:amidohydrolase family protein [Natronincola ferrireducens]SDK08608.1 Amidohydrolase family protein [Natronincola ferrireducens]
MEVNVLKPAEMVFQNGIVYTVDKERSWAEAVAVANEKIVYVGDNKGVEKFIGGDTKVIDLEGKMLLPGFIDAHAHPNMAAFFSMGVKIDMTADYNETLKSIKKYIEENPERNEYFGFGYNEDLFDEKGPKKEVLDALCLDKPIFILSSGGHSGWGNSKAFEVAGVDRKHPDPIPGFHYYKRDAMVFFKNFIIYV